MTASIFGDVMAHMCSHTSSASLLDRICERQSVVKSRCPPALQWGRDNEQAAIDLLMKGLSASHVHARFERSGLIVKKEYPFLGASPDGIFACECAGCPRKRVVEVKCPYSRRDRDPSEAQHFNSDGELCKTHKHYAQVQGEMALAGVSECFFVTFTRKGIFVLGVPLDESYVGTLFSTLRSYYVNEVLPAMLSR